MNLETLHIYNITPMSLVFPRCLAGYLTTLVTRSEDAAKTPAAEPSTILKNNNNTVIIIINGLYLIPF